MCRRAENCGHSAVAVHLRGHRYPCRGAKAFSHGPGGPSRFPSCSFSRFGRADFLVQVWRRQSYSNSCSSSKRQMPCGSVRRKLRIFPQLRLFNKVVHFPVVVQSLFFYGFRFPCCCAQGGRGPYCIGRASSTVAVCEETVVAIGRRRVPCRDAEADQAVQQIMSLLDKVDDVPGVQVVLDSLVPS